MSQAKSCGCAARENDRKNLGCPCGADCPCGDACGCGDSCGTKPKKEQAR